MSVLALSELSRVSMLVDADWISEDFRVRGFTLPIVPLVTKIRLLCWSKLSLHVIFQYTTSKLHPLRTGLNLKACFFLVLWFVCLGYETAAVPVQVHSINSIGKPSIDQIHNANIQRRRWNVEWKWRIEATEVELVYSAKDLDKDEAVAVPSWTERHDRVLPRDMAVKVKPAIQNAIDANLLQGNVATVQTPSFHWFEDVPDPRISEGGVARFTLVWKDLKSGKSFQSEGDFMIVYEKATKYHIAVNLYTNTHGPQSFPMVQHPQIYTSGDEAVRALQQSVLR
ncbi:hypothetical protein EV360DRAFT_69901 [Lentinula raphanica]|nr:hypothetical protein EV360DRAFT_69901 [Lentinula raphanica]